MFYLILFSFLTLNYENTSFYKDSLILGSIVTSFWRTTESLRRWNNVWLTNCWYRCSWRMCSFSCTVLPVEKWIEDDIALIRARPQTCRRTMKFGGSIAPIFRNIEKNIFSPPNRKSAMLDFVRWFSFHEHMFEDFRIHKNSPMFNLWASLVYNRGFTESSTIWIFDHQNY